MSRELCEAKWRGRGLQVALKISIGVAAAVAIYSLVCAFEAQSGGGPLTGESAVVGSSRQHLHGDSVRDARGAELPVASAGRARVSTTKPRTTGAVGAISGFDQAMADAGSPGTCVLHSEFPSRPRRSSNSSSAAAVHVKSGGGLNPPSAVRVAGGTGVSELVPRTRCSVATRIRRPARGRRSRASPAQKPSAHRSRETLCVHE